MKTDKIINYIGKSGKKYTYDKYKNFGSGDRGKIKDLPLDDYPYTLEYFKSEK